MREIYVVVSEILLLVGAGLASLEGEFWAAIAGAVVGGVIAYLIQKASLKDAKKARAEERLLSDRALAFSLLFKVITISGSFHVIKDQVDRARVKAQAENIKDMASVLLPIMNLPSAVEFSAAEMAMLLSLKEDDTFNRILSLDLTHNSILPVWAKYASHRDDVNELLTETEFDSIEGKSEFSIPPGSPLQRKMYETNMVADELVRRSSIDLAAAKVALAGLSELFNRRLKLGLKIAIAGTEV